MTQSNLWSSTVKGEEETEEVPLAVQVFSYLQIVISVLAMIVGLAKGVGSYWALAAEDIPLVDFLGTILLTTIPFLVVGFLMIRVALAVKTLESWSFPWIIYGNIILMLLSILGGGFALYAIFDYALMIVWLFVPEIKEQWWNLFKEDMGPRMKETKYSLYLIRRSPLVVAGIFIIAAYIFLAIFAPYITPYGATERDWYATLQPPSAEHLWGTDQNGGDVFSMVIWATQIDLRIAISVVAVALILGSFIGAAAGYFGGAVDEVVMRITDVFFAFPGLILAMAIVAALGERNLDNISIALMLVWWPTYARLVRGQVLIEREKLYVEAARSVGASDMRILVFHILPNTIQPVIVQATLDMGGVLLTAAGLSFIGFGAEAGTAEWGWMISQGQNHFMKYWVTFYPGMAILLCALSFNLVGDGVRDILDPKLRRR